MFHNKHLNITRRCIQVYSCHFQRLTSARRSQVEFRSFVSKGSLPGGFTRQGLQDYAQYFFWNERNSGSSDSDSSNRLAHPRQREIKDNSPTRVTRKILDHHSHLLYTDLYSLQISDKCNTWLDHHPDASGQLAKSFFGSLHFVPERLLLMPACYFLEKGGTRAERKVTTGSSSSSSSSSLGSQSRVSNRSIMFSMPEFHVGDQFLAWNVVRKSPLELICSWTIGHVRGLTMVAFDPKLKRIYHGNCMDISSISSSCSQHIFKMILLPLHKQYANFLLHGMRHSLERQVPKGGGDGGQ